MILNVSEGFQMLSANQKTRILQKQLKEIEVASQENPELLEQLQAIEKLGKYNERYNKIAELVRKPGWKKFKVSEEHSLKKGKEDEKDNV